MRAGIQREGWGWSAIYRSKDGGMDTFTFHLTKWGARRAARRWVKRQMQSLPVEWVA